ncbi:ABC transporter ATP-binding protein [Mycobacterium sp. NAZ190054]|uniref:dipeptide ABC transporter ATP-binding protein n=1 Tax=Mycobacterium sp. NAZ190054 TaxID=1747766 RepID=UPI000794D397|nr:ABC transporter ATP-binding protein [Mycobacterium sp. NAZ190054]KWX66127.1 hypothetical protein ASJ79_06640 [Mycobacterium sp. NAZ190054]
MTASTTSAGSTLLGTAGTGPADAVVEVADLAVTLHRDRTRLPVLRGVDLTVARNEIVGVVGESGSGKTVLGQTVLGMLPKRSRPKVEGAIRVAGVDMVGARERTRRKHRSATMGAVFQDPMVSLDPTMRIGKQVLEATGGDRAEALRLMAAARIPDPEQRMSQFPHELSGGLRQRVMIAMAIAGNPDLVIADEPTTALDVSVQAQILDLILDLRRDTGMSFILITHDLAAAARVCDRIAVMYAGQIVETGDTATILANPQHPYTAALFNARIDLHSDRSHPLPTLAGAPPPPGSVGTECAFAQRCPAVTPECRSMTPPVVSLAAGHQVRCLHAGHAAGTSQPDTATRTEWPAAQQTNSPALLLHDLVKTFQHGSRRAKTSAQVLRGVSLQLHQGDSLAIVGESGCGKSTLLKVAAGLLTADSGTVDLPRNASVQMVFQDAGASLTPWLTIGEQISDCLRAAGTAAGNIAAELDGTLHRVGLPAAAARSLPRQLSGGQKQRAAIARALAARPTVLLCDEPTSALDASVAAVVLNLLGRLRRELGLAVVFVTHDLAAARLIADRVAVMYLGRIVEIGPSDEITGSPRHPYTQGLLASLPEACGGHIRLQGDPASPTGVPSGCAFHPRCPLAADGCAVDDQALRPLTGDHLLACTIIAEGSR